MFEKRAKSHHDSGGMIDKYVEKVTVTEKDFLESLEKEPENIPRVIYVHTPYCDKICSFCNLNRKQIDGSLGEYADYIASEFDKYGKTNYFKKLPFDVIFFGGGTPTVYKPEQLEVILSSIKRNVTLADGYEFTFETTLHNLNKAKLDIMMEYGVNRLSVGIQSFSERGRIFYNRTYNKNETIKKIKELKEYFNGDVCIDIIYNFPNQTEEEVVEDAKIIKEIGISSASFYSLMVHEGSNLSKDIKDEKVKISNTLEKEKKLHNKFVEELCKDGDYYILELTKIAMENGDRYKYIKARSSGGDTFPIGTGAGGNVGNFGVFRMNKNMSFFSNKSEYHKKFGKLSGMMQFPKMEKKAIRKILTEKEYEYFLEKVMEYKEKGLFTENEKEFTLTSEGLFWGNNIASSVTNYVISKAFEK